MAYYEQEFDEYKIIHWSNYEDELARINCYLSGGLVGILYFSDNENSELPRMVNRTIHLMFPENQLHEIITTLRYEKPLFLFYNDSDSPPFGGVKTSAHEPVGEEES